MPRIIYSSKVYDKLRVAPSRITGLGLFAGCPIPARAKIGEFEGEVISIREARRRARGRKVVAIVELDRHAIDAGRTRRGFRYINHSCAPNTFTRLTAQRAEFYRTMRQDLDRLNTTINNVLHAAMYTDRPVLDPQPLDFARLVRRAVELTRTRFQLGDEAVQGVQG